VCPKKRALKEHQLEEERKKRAKEASERAEREKEFRRYTVQDAIEAKTFDDLKSILASILRTQGAKEKRG
jgi:hypothetical protein